LFGLFVGARTVLLTYIYSPPPRRWAAYRFIHVSDEYDSMW
jgi:hypothetical protein